MQAHPRSRGENLGGIGDETEVAGSSPLTRGKRVLACEGCVPERLIPAHAGKTQTAAAVRSTRRAHPRSRGDNPFMRFTDLLEQGSSPLTRGKLGAGGTQMKLKGLIPAHAGKTLPDLRFYRADRSDLGKP